MPVLPNPSKDEDPLSSSSPDDDDDDDDGKEDRRCEEEEEEVRAMENDDDDDDDDDDGGGGTTTTASLLLAAMIVAPEGERNPAEDGRNSRMRSHGAIVLLICYYIWCLVGDVEEVSNKHRGYLRDARHLSYCYSTYSTVYLLFDRRGRSNF